MANSKITPEMIEAAAQAIRDVVAGRSAFPRPWNALPPALRDEYRAEAIAALSAGLAAVPARPMLHSARSS